MNATNKRNKKKGKSNTSAENWKIFRIARNKVHVVIKNVHGLAKVPPRSPPRGR